MGRLMEIQKELSEVLKHEAVNKYIRLVAEKEMIEYKIRELEYELDILRCEYDNLLCWLSDEIEHKIVGDLSGYKWEIAKSDEYLEVKEKCEKCWCEIQVAEKQLKEWRVEL